MPITQAALRELMTTDSPKGQYLLAAVQSLASIAEVNFVMPRKHMYEVYRDRLGISKEVTGHWFEGLQETVAALHQARYEEVRLISASTEPGECVVFTDSNMQEVIGIIYFPTKA